MKFLDEFDNKQNLENIFNNVCKRSKPGLDKITSKKYDYYNNLNIIKTKIEKMNYKFTRFEVILKPKKHYQLPRLIFTSTIRDRFVSKIMCTHCLEKYKNMDYIPSKTRNNVLKNIKELLSEKTGSELVYKYFLRIDISNYYDSINRELLISFLIKDEFDKSFVSLVKSMFKTMDISVNIPTGKGIPQGISLSSILAERYLKDVDLKYNIDKQVKLIRYVDDILILTSSEKILNSVNNKITFDLRSVYGLNINNEKNEKGKISESNFDFLGINISNGKLSISDSQYKRVQEQLTELFKWYKRNTKEKSNLFLNAKNHLQRLDSCLLEKLNLLITGYFYKNSFTKKISKFGWVITSLPQQLDDLEKLKKLDAYVCTLIDNYVNDNDRSSNLKSRKKSFYLTYLKYNYSHNKGMYVLNQDEIAKNDELMYKITCNLSLIDLKKDLDYDNYNKEEFEEKVEESLYDYFKKTLYISNRNLTTDILYW